MAGQFQFDTGGWKPQYELSALWQGENNARAEEAQHQDLIKERIANYVAQQEAPNKIAASNLAGLQARNDMGDATQQARTAGNIGTFKSAQAKGDVDMGTKDSTILSNNARNTESAAADTELGQNRAVSMWNSIEGTPEEKAVQAKIMGMPDSIISRFVTNPDAANAAGRMRTDRAFTDPKHIRELELKALEHNYGMEKQRLVNEGSAASASIASDGRDRPETMKYYRELGAELHNLERLKEKYDDGTTKLKDDILKRNEFMREEAYKKLSTASERQAYLDKKMENYATTSSTGQEAARIQGQIDRVRKIRSGIEGELGYGSIETPKSTPSGASAPPPGITLVSPSTPSATPPKAAAPVTPATVMQPTPAPVQTAPVVSPPKIEMAKPMSIMERMMGRRSMPQGTGFNIPQPSQAPAKRTYQDISYDLQEAKKAYDALQSSGNQAAIIKAATRLADLTNELKSSR